MTQVTLLKTTSTNTLTTEDWLRSTSGEPIWSFKPQHSTMTLDWTQSDESSSISSPEVRLHRSLRAKARDNASSFERNYPW
jgi:hypothetical protein